MSYYDDLGVSRHASPEEIREAYKILVRLLHPDQQTDPVLKRAAEWQMRRFNAIYSVLSDPDQRRRYDGETAVAAPVTTPAIVRPPVPVPIRRGIELGTLIWIAVAIFSLGAIFLIAVLLQPRGVRPGTQAVLSQALRSATAPTPSPRQRIPEGIPQAKGQEEKPAVTAPAKATEIPAITTMAPPGIETRPPAAPNLPAPNTIVKPPRRGFAGFWVYLHDRDKRQSGKYPPQFIQAAITERDGQIQGRYRARYFVSDRPISPNVSFDFEGEVAGTSAKLAWHGDGGSQGLVEITLRSDDEMELIWRATDFGQSLGLASGTAILTRRPE